MAGLIPDRFFYGASFLGFGIASDIPDAGDRATCTGGVGVSWPVTGLVT